jgi:hypothetical protein
MSREIRIHHIDDRPRYLNAAPEEITRACQLRFDLHKPCATTRRRNVFRFDPQNFWDGPTEVRLLPNGNLEFTRVYGDIEEFDLAGRTVNVRSR